jgi:hypothetical protein
MLLSSTDPEITLQQARLILPPQIYPGVRDEIIILPPDYQFYFSRFDRLVRQALEINVEAPGSETLKVGDAFMPVVIDSVYTTKGRLYQDKSLYYLNYFVVWGEGELPSLEYRSLQFIERLAAEQDPVEHIRARWEQGLT